MIDSKIESNKKNKFYLKSITTTKKIIAFQHLSPKKNINFLMESIKIKKNILFRYRKKNHLQ